MPVLQNTRAWMKQHPIAATAVASIVFHGLVFAVIGMQKLDSEAPHNDYVMIDLVSPDVPVEEVVVEQKLEVLKPVVKVDLATTATNEPAAAALSTGETEAAGIGDRAPVQLAMLKAGMQADTGLKHTDALDFDESLMLLSSKGSADQILTATARVSEGSGGPGFLPGGVGIGYAGSLGGGSNGPVCK